MYWLVSLPLNEAQDRIWSRLQSKTAYESDLAQSFRFELPELRVGTLDSLMVLSDDLVKVHPHPQCSYIAYCMLSIISHVPDFHFIASRIVGQSLFRQVRAEASFF